MSADIFMYKLHETSITLSLLEILWSFADDFDYLLFKI